MIEYKNLPQNAQEELLMYCDPKKDKIEIIADPNVDSTYALQIHRENDDYTFHLLWYKGGYDEVDFDTWPPEVGEPQFFI